MFKQPLVAIDIGSSAIKVVESVGGASKKLGAIGLEMLPNGAVVDGAIQDAEVVQNTLEELLKRLKILTPTTKTLGRRVALSLGGSSVIVKRINVALSAETELDEQVYYEAEQHFQSDLSDIYFYHTKLGGDEAAQEVPILLAGARREVVEEYLAIVRGIGFRTGVIECDVLSATNMFEYNYGVLEGLAAVVNVGATLTQISLLYHGEYLFTREIPIGGNEYSNQIMDTLAVDYDNAETLKISASSGDANAPEELHTAITNVNEQIVGEVQTSLDFFYTSGILPPEAGGINALFLTGGGSRVLGLDAAFAANLQVPVNIVNPFQRVEINPSKFDMDYISMQGHLYGIAVGLSLRELNDYK